MPRTYPQPAPELASRYRWTQHGAIAHRRPTAGTRRGQLFRGRRPLTRRNTPTHPSRAWVSPDTAALLHGAVIGYVWKGAWLARLDWDILEWAACHLLGYAFEPHGLSHGHLFRALQAVALRWPPPPTFRAALHDIIDTWASADAIDKTRWRHNVLRLRRARAILEQWNP